MKTFWFIWTCATGIWFLAVTLYIIFADGDDWITRARKGRHE